VEGGVCCEAGSNEGFTTRKVGGGKTIPMCLGGRKGENSEGRTIPQIWFSLAIPQRGSKKKKKKKKKKS